MAEGGRPALSAVILGCEGLRLTGWERDFFRDCAPAGFILFARNIEAPGQLRALTEDLRTSVGWNAPILIDQEGGRVARMGPPHWRADLPPLDQALRAGDGAARSFWLRYRLIGAELAAVGIDMNCAPVADIAGPLTHPFLRNRCLGTTADAVIANARAAAEGLRAAGVLPVIKHMPGHGRGQVDSHLHLPRTDAPLAELEAEDFRVFRALADLPAAMTAHLVYSALDPAAPATTSAAVLGYLRSRIGFGGLLMSDDISMQALSGSVGERSRAAVAAGCDLVLHCNGDPAEMMAVAEAAGPLSPAGQARLHAALACRNLPEAIDTAALEAELGALLGGQGDG